MTRQVVQARISDNFMYLFAMSASLSKFDDLLRSEARGKAVDRDRASLRHFFDMAEQIIGENTRAIWNNADASMLTASEKAIEASDEQPNHLFVIPEKSPVAAGTGRTPDQRDIKQFPGDPSSLQGEGVEETGGTETASV